MRPLNSLLSLCTTDCLPFFTKLNMSNCDAVYTERNLLVALLTKLLPSYRALHPVEDTSWEDDWRNIIFITLPNGEQASWHIHDSELVYFQHLELCDNNWDGHTTEEKYNRIKACLNS